MIGHRKKVLLLVVAVLLPSALSAENIRGPLSDSLVVSSTSGTTRATVGLDDLLGVSIGGGARFMKGVEIDLTIPPAARQYRDLLALYVFKRVTPPPSNSVNLYSGSRAGFVVLPTSARIYVNIPMKPNAIEPSPETTTLTGVVPPSEFPLILAVLPVAKGLPDTISNSQFTVKVSPILEDEGLLKLKLSQDGKPPEFSYELSIDGQPTPIDPSGYALPTGIHNITISSSHYEEANATIGIDKGQTTTLDLALKPLVPTLLFEAPSTAEIFLDGQKLMSVPKKPIPVTEGEHTVIIRVGNYSLTKKFSVERGRSYKVSLFLDILVQEN